LLAFSFNQINHLIFALTTKIIVQMKITATIFFLVILSSINLFAQDIIILKNGDEIKAKVTEIGVREIKYKKTDNLSGPDFLILKSEVFMITFENGTKEIFKEDAKSKNVSQKANPGKGSFRILYGGFSVPVSGNNNYSDVPFGFTTGMEGLAYLGKPGLFFDFDLGISLRPVDSYDYNMITGLVGFRIQGNSPKIKLYTCLKVGAAVTWRSNNSGVNVALSPCFGMIINKSFNIGVKYIYAKPSSGYDSSVQLAQLVFGYVF
jgi:hypothetical protein